MTQIMLDRLEVLKMLTQTVVDDIDRKQAAERRASTYFNLLKQYAGKQTQK